MSHYFKLLKSLKNHRRNLSIAVAAMLVTSIFKGAELSMLVPLMDRILNQKKIIVPDHLPEFLNKIVAQLNAIEPQALLTFLPFVILGMLLLKHGFVYLYQYLMNDISQQVMRDVRSQLYNKIQSQSMDFFSKKRTGELISRITHDVQLIENAVSYAVTDLFFQGFSILIYICIAFSIHFKAAAIIFLVFPLIALPISQLGRRLRKIAKSSQERMADINSILLETIGGIKVVKAFCTERFEMDRFHGKNHQFYKLKMKSIKRTLLTNPLTEIFGAVCAIIIILWLGRQVMHQELSFGVFVLFFASIMSTISPVKKMGNVNLLIQQALSANERIYEILDRQPTIQEKLDALELPTIRERIHFENVWFRYDEESGDVLKGINLEVKVGELVAIVGPTGTGKTTLANLIPRFYDPYKGRVSIDRTDIRQVTFRSLRRQIGIVAQETFLFNDTVRANIAYGCPQISQEDVESAAKKAYAHDFIMKMPQGYDTIIGDRGFRLSGGEKQRIAIARAIVKNPAILILDEATSQLDSESEKFVQEALDLLMQGRTVIAIAHRLSTIKKADKIVVLDRGQVVGIGRHDELLNSSPLYRRLYETQFQT
ncbi:MAG: ABC transporter ATP-binding protein/permease [Candidatus Omnitrophica bacterium]|nr:ABC transporter ATP-binding protein/permease [Candidatus Omnitrophota bacterium]